MPARRSTRLAGGVAIPAAPSAILIEILGPPLAVSVESAKPHDVQSARRTLKDQLDALPARQP